MIDISIFIASFVTFFVVIDPIGVAPIFASLTNESSAQHRRWMAIKSVLIASGVLFGFAFFGEWLLDTLHVSLDAFRIAGGILLLLVALEMVFEKRSNRRKKRVEEVNAGSQNIDDFEDDISVFPMAIPMLAGPGAIASIILFMNEAEKLSDQLFVFAGMGVTLFTCLVLFLFIGAIMKLLGDTTAAMITRILGVILSALAIQFMIDGLKGAFLG